VSCRGAGCLSISSHGRSTWRMSSLVGSTSDRC